MKARYVASENQVQYRNGYDSAWSAHDERRWCRFPSTQDGVCNRSGEANKAMEVGYQIEKYATR